MKLTYSKQIFLTIAIIFLFNLMNTLLAHWVWSSLGKCLCGLLWIVHPVLPSNLPKTDKNRKLARLAGVVLILYGVFSRTYLY